jgi:hypothetical protein
VPRTDIRMVQQNMNYDWRPKGTPLSDFGVSSFTNVDWNRQSRFQDGFAGAGFFLNFRRASGFNIDHLRAYELFQNIGFHKEMTEMFFYSDRFKRVGFNAYFSNGTGVNYSPAEGVYASLASNQSETRRSPCGRIRGSVSSRRISTLASRMCSRITSSVTP